MADTERKEKMSTYPAVLFIGLLIIFSISHYAIPLANHRVWTEDDVMGNRVVKFLRYGKYGRESISEYTFSWQDGHWRYHIRWGRFLGYSAVCAFFVLLFSNEVQGGTRTMMFAFMGLLFVAQFLLAPVVAYLFLKHEEES